MTGWSRRRFARLAGLLPLTLGAPAVLGRAKAQVVVVGGGAGGATVAKYLARAHEDIAVTLVEPDARYQTCFFSNLYLGGLRERESLLHGYAALQERYGIRLVPERAAAIDSDGHKLRLAGGESLAYDRLVLAPGIEVLGEAIPGYDESVMPHAWSGGAQLDLLKRRIEAMEDGGLFLLAAPDNPYRCPPGPYERVSMVALYLKRHKPRSKILVIDAKNSFSKQPLFLDAWASHYPGLVEWLPADFTGGITRIDAKSGTIVTPSGAFTAGAACVIPPQRAGWIAQEAGLADESGWCPVDPETFESLRLPGVHLVGDAIQPGDMPKSAFAANSQAKACAAAIATALMDAPRVEPRFFNTCWSFLAEDDAVAIGARYRIEAGRITSDGGFLSERSESPETRARAARQAEGWYRAFTEDLFG